MLLMYEYTYLSLPLSRTSPLMFLSERIMVFQNFSPLRKLGLNNARYIIMFLIELIMVFQNFSPLCKLGSNNFRNIMMFLIERITVFQNFSPLCKLGLNNVRNIITSAFRMRVRVQSDADPLTQPWIFSIRIRITLHILWFADQKYPCLCLQFYLNKRLGEFDVFLF